MLTASKFRGAFFLGFSDLLDHEMINNLYVCDSVFLSFSDRFASVTLVVSFIKLDIVNYLR